MKNIDQIIKTLTLDEKVSLLSGFNSWYTNKIEKKNVPSIKMSDGPMEFEAIQIQENLQLVFLVQYQ